MPVYDYKCSDHGLFHELATMAEAGNPKACPKCGKASARVIMIPPEVLAMAPDQRAAMAHNEEARHQPIISSVDSRAEAADRAAFAQRKDSSNVSRMAGHQHGRGCCGHSHGKSHGHAQQHAANHEHVSENSALKQQVVFLPDGSKVFPSQRPWMISH